MKSDAPRPVDGFGCDVGGGTIDKSVVFVEGEAVIESETIGVASGVTFVVIVYMVSFSVLTINKIWDSGKGTATAACSWDIIRWIIT